MQTLLAGGKLDSQKRDCRLEGDSAKPRDSECSTCGSRLASKCVLPLFAQGCISMASESLRMFAPGKDDHWDCR